MKEVFDREIDSLLRRHARGTAESRLWGDGVGDGSAGSHLDADELGAFAEGALPAAARVAAASHLADCERCRGVVVGLARVAGAEAEVKPQAVAATVSAKSERTPAWRALLASLFSPRAMRFAVPVLALSLVGVVSYVALRSKDGEPLQMTRDTGRRPGTLQEQPNASVAPGDSAANTNTSGFATQNTNAAPQPEGATVVQPSRPGGHGGAEAQPVETDTASKGEQPSETTAQPPPPPPAAAAPEGPADMAKSAPRPVTSEEDEVSRNEGRDRADTREKSARASEPVDDLAANEATQQRRAVQSRGLNQVQMPDGSNARNEKRADNNASNVYGGTPASPRESERAGSRAVGRSRAAKEAEKKADEDGAGRGSDTRTVEGRRFRREGNTWVDVNYKRTMSSTGVRRGTEAFRALVAEVPVVGRVAGAIGGEVIIVVGNRAYRIR